MVCGKESGCGEGVRLFADPRIPNLYSRFGVRETGFSESWLSSALLSREVRFTPPLSFPDWGIVLRGIGIPDSLLEELSQRIPASGITVRSYPNPEPLSGFKFPILPDAC